MENSRTQRFIFGLLSLLWDTLFFGCLLFTTILQKNPCASSGIATVLSLTRKRSLRRSLRILWSPWSLEQERSNCMQFWPFFDVARITVWFVECQRSYGFDGWWTKQNWTAWLIPRTLFYFSGIGLSCRQIGTSKGWRKLPPRSRSWEEPSRWLASSLNTEWSNIWQPQLLVP